MKANEAPEKIYLNPLLMEDAESVVRRCTSERQRGSQIEYTRTDAFIEKTVDWLKESVTNNPECNRIISKKGVITMGLLIKDFKNYMKGK
jgi:hypothetical protein